MLFRGVNISYETIRNWCNKFGGNFSNVIKKKERKPTDKWHLQQTIALMGKTRNIFAIAVGRYTNSADEQRKQFAVAKKIWNEAANGILCA